MQLEVCVDSLESAANAIFSRADEIELCRALWDGGLTPSLELVEQVRFMIDLYSQSVPKNVDIKRPKLNVMIRCHEGWDFHYSSQELAKMIQDMTEIKKIGVDRFVFGSLTPNLEVDEGPCRAIVEHARPLPVTFHRAFDRVKDPYEAMKKIIALGFDRVLTSGQKESAADKQAYELLKSLVAEFGKHIDIMPGGGVTLANVVIFLDLGCKYIHGSFKKPKSSYAIGGNMVTDSETVSKVKKILKTHKEQQEKAQDAVIQELINEGEADNETENVRTNTEKTAKTDEDAKEIRNKMPKLPVVKRDDLEKED